MQVARLLSCAALLCGCYGGEEQGVAASEPSRGDAKAQGVTSTPASASAARDAGSGPSPRVDLSSLPAAEQQRINDAIDGYIRTAKLSVPARRGEVVPWEDPSEGKVSVSVVRAHHAIHHQGEHFLTCHRWYLGQMEAAIGHQLPNGRLPSWKPSAQVPAPFFQLAPPTGGDCETLGSVSSTNNSGLLCEFAYTNSYTNVHGRRVNVKGLETQAPAVPIPTRYTTKEVCKFPSVGALADDLGGGFGGGTGFHTVVHETIGGTMRTMDSPAAPIFWVWHATVDEIYQRWIDCKVAAPKACPTN